MFTEARIERVSSLECQKSGAALLEDDCGFIDHSKSTAFTVEEREKLQWLGQTRVSPRIHERI